MLKAGDRVVVDGTVKVQPGSPVQVAPENPGAGGASGASGAAAPAADAKQDGAKPSGN